MGEGSFGRTRRGPGSWADLAVAALTIGAVVLLLVPLPTPILDVLLAANLATSLVLLLVAVQVDNPLRVAAFPTWLVLNTLLRLALNVASTRLILLQADAGRVIGAYGELVAGANAIVGGVLFALLTIVQFVVIARGAERVAEVGARFVLDGLPGKQMAIDAELRAGTLDARGAEARRERLVQESQFFGAMDGAMKFVKGDVVASLLVIAVNLLGGFGIGMTEQGLDAVTALQRYGLLTIGDGLAAQIPALLVATAAGVLVTRVAGDTRAGIGAELASQLLRHPRVLRWVGAACLLVAIAPHMPPWPFVTAGLACGLASLLPPTSVDADAGGATFGVAVAPDLASWLPAGRLARWQIGLTPLERVLAALRETVLRPLGLPRRLLERDPVLRLDPRLPAGTLELLVRGMPVHRVEQVSAVPVADAVARLLEELADPLRRHAADLLTLEEVQHWLDEIASRSPVTVREAVPAKAPLTTFAEALRLLLREQVPLTQLDAVLDALAHPSVSLPDRGDPRPLAALARRASRRALSQAISGAEQRVRCLRFDELIEDTIREAAHFSPRGATLTLAPAAARDILAALGRSVEALGPPSGGRRRRPDGGATPLVLLTPSDLRPLARELLAADFPLLPVVSADELLSHLQLEPAGVVRLTGPPTAPAVVGAAAVDVSIPAQPRGRCT